MWLLAYILLGQKTGQDRSETVIGILRPTRSSGLLPPAQAHPLDVLLPSKTAPPAGELMLKHRSLWGRLWAFHIRSHLPLTLRYSLRWGLTMELSLVLNSELSPCLSFLITGVYYHAQFKSHFKKKNYF